jgi:hypothetical protein
MAAFSLSLSLSLSLSHSFNFISRLVGMVRRINFLAPYFFAAAAAAYSQKPLVSSYSQPSISSNHEKNGYFLRISSLHSHML